MSTKPNDGGPAFPFGQISELTGQPINGYYGEGMTLRDYLANSYEPDISNIRAADAVSLGVTAPYRDDTIGRAKWKAAVRARLRYIEADAMLAARQVGDDN